MENLVKAVKDGSITNSDDLRNKALTNIKNVIDGLFLDDQYSVYSEYCQSNSYDENEPFPISMLDELLEGKSPTEVMSLCEGFEYRSAEYFNWGVYGIEKWNGIEACELDDIAAYTLDNEENYDIDDIEDIIDDYNEAFEILEELEEERQ